MIYNFSQAIVENKIVCGYKQEEIYNWCISQHYVFQYQYMILILIAILSYIMRTNLYWAFDKIKENLVNENMDETKAEKLILKIIAILDFAVGFCIIAFAFIWLIQNDKINILSFLKPLLFRV
jgi:hypothetical protein